jgi:hypothetical protein
MARLLPLSLPPSLLFILLNENQLLLVLFSYS